MKKVEYFVFGFLVVVAVLTTDYLKSEKKGFIVNQELFRGYHGKADLEAKLDQLRSEHKLLLDSISSQSHNFKDQQDWIIYYETRDELQAIEREFAGKYTAQIWERLNDYVSEYGRSNHYDMILGAKGDGGLMYANEGMNITAEVLDYVNKKYEGE